MDFPMMSLWHDFHNQALLCMPLSLLTGEAADAKAPNPSTTSVPGPAEPIYPAKPIPAAATGLPVSRYLPNGPESSSVPSSYSLACCPSLSLKGLCLKSCCVTLFPYRHCFVPCKTFSLPDMQSVLTD